jgi:hypothetical protein
VLAIVPVAMIPGYFEGKMRKHTYNDASETSVGGNIVQENITEIKTVRSINTI